MNLLIVIYFVLSISSYHDRKWRHTSKAIIVIKIKNVQDRVETTIRVQYALKELKEGVKGIKLYQRKIMTWVPSPSYALYLSMVDLRGST